MLFYFVSTKNLVQFFQCVFQIRFATKTEMSTSEVVIILMSAFALAMALNTLQATPGQPRIPSPNTEILQWLLLMESFKSGFNARSFAEISKTVHETAQPVFLTKNGYGDMVVLSMEAFENLQFESEVYFKLQAAEREAELSSERYSSKDVLKAMKDAIGGSRVV